MAQPSFTGLINTKDEFVTVESLTNLTFTVGKTYLIQTNAITYVKVADAIIEVYDQKPYQFIAGTDDLYIKTDFCGCKLTVYENESSN